MLFDSLSGLLRVLVVSILGYSVLILALRIYGKRSLAKLNAFDLVVTVALGSTLATVILSKDVALAEGVVALLILLALQWVVSSLSLAWRPFKDIVRSEARLVLEDGKILPQALEDERLTPSEVEAAVRTAGIGRLEDVAAVVLETDGSMSVIPRGDEPPAIIAGLRR